MPKIINAEEFAVIKTIEIEKEKGEVNAILTFSFNGLKPQYSKVCEDTISEFKLVELSKNGTDIQYKINGAKKIGEVIAKIEAAAKKNKLVSAKDHDFFVTVYSNLLEFCDFPQEILLHIFQFISDNKDLASVARVDKVWNQLSEHNAIWQIQPDTFQKRMPGELKRISKFFHTPSSENMGKTILSQDEIRKLAHLISEKDLENLCGIIVADHKNEITNNKHLWKNRNNFEIDYTSYTFILGNFNTYQMCLSANPKAYYIILFSAENENVMDALHLNFSEFFANRWEAVIRKNDSQQLKQWDVAICTKPPVIQEQIAEIYPS